MKVFLSSLYLALVVYAIVEVDVVDGNAPSVNLEKLRELLEERKLDSSSDEELYEREAPAIGPSNQQIEPISGEELLSSNAQQANEEEARAYLEPQGDQVDEAIWDQSAVEELKERDFSDSLDEADLEERAFSDSLDEADWEARALSDSMDEADWEERALSDSMGEAGWDDSAVEEQAERSFSDSDLFEDERSFDEDPTNEKNQLPYWPREVEDDSPPQPEHKKPAAYVEEADSAMEKVDGYDAAVRKAWPYKMVDDNVALDEVETRGAEDEEQMSVSSFKASNDKYASRREKLKKLFGEKVTEAQRYDGLVDFGILGKLRLSGVVVTLTDDRQFFIRRRFRKFGRRRWGATSIRNAKKMNTKFWKKSGDPKKVGKSTVRDYVKACKRTSSSLSASKKMMALK